MEINLDPQIGPRNQGEGEIHRWFGLSYNSFLILPRVMLQEMPLKWQEQFVALLEQAEAMGVRTPGFEASMKNPDTNRYCKIPEQWLNYRRGTLKDAMATMKEDEL